MSIRLAYCQSYFNSGLSTPNCARRFLARCPFSQTHTFPFFPFFFGQHGSEELFAAATVWTCSFCILKWLLSNVWLIISTKPLLPSLPLTTVKLVIIYLLFQWTFCYMCAPHCRNKKSNLCSLWPCTGQHAGCRSPRAVCVCQSLQSTDDFTSGLEVWKLWCACVCTRGVCGCGCILLNAHLCLLQLML